MTGKNYDLDAVRRVSCLDYLDAMGIPLRAGRCAATWRDGHNPQSVAVYADHFFDHATGEHGTVIDLAMKIEGLTTGDAIRRIAERFGIPATDGTIAPRKAKPKPQPYWPVVCWAAKTNQIDQLTNEDEAKWARLMRKAMRNDTHQELEIVTRAAIDLQKKGGC